VAKNADGWDYIITAKSRWFDIDLGSIWRYRDLLLQFVRRDFVSVYKQTILGPVWIFLQPLLTTIIFTVVFGYVIKVRTGQSPPFLFFMCALIPWNFFADCLNKTSGSFLSNSNLFGKVYFPRIITPISIVISSFIRFSVQFLLFLIVYSYYALKAGTVGLNYHIAFLPVLLLLLSGIGFAIGLIVTSATTKYRDLAFLVAFGTQLLLYASPVIYSYDSVGQPFRSWLAMNPLTWIVEGFRSAFLNTGLWSWNGLAYSAVVMLILLILSIGLFSKVQKTFMDTI
jgi:homopolymeric O-antigen transport system permease protein